MSPDFWQRFVATTAGFFRSRYVRLLEEELERLRAEVDRLRSENRALVNSLLGTAGIPPIEGPEMHAARPAIPQVRRRSWHQLQALHEFEEARKARERVEVARQVDAGHTPERGPFH